METLCVEFGLASTGQKVVNVSMAIRAIKSQSFAEVFTACGAIRDGLL